MKLTSSIASRPFFWFILLGLLVASIPISVIFTYNVMSGRVEHSIQFTCDFLREQVLNEIRIISGFILPVNASALNLARNLRSYHNETHSSFSRLETTVAPKLFLAYLSSSISEISYMGSDGLFLSYYKEGNQTLIMYSNTSHIERNPNASTLYDWYTQQVDGDTGIPFGEPAVTNSFFFVNSSWYQEAMDSNSGYSLVGTGWGKTNASLFFSMATITGGVVSLGLSINNFVEAISNVNTLKGTLFLATRDGNLLAHSGSLNASMTIKNDDISLEFTKAYGDLISTSVNFSCQPSNNPLRVYDVEINGEDYRIYCEPLEIAGIQSVSVLVFPQHGLLTEIQKNDHLSLILLVLSLISMVFVLLFFIFSTFQSFLKEMFLLGKLMQQKEATQQAERKIMRNSLAYAKPSHEIRGSLTAIISLIDSCRSGGSDIDHTLSEMKNCTLELIEFLNSVLDTSKIEAGMMQLEEKDFDLAQVIEEVVNMFYLKGKETGIDVVLDPCDGSVLKPSLVRGDRGKLKQVLINLVSNAIKFTSEGHVTVRAWVRKPTVESSILASKSNGIWKSISRLIYKNNDEPYGNALRMDEHNQNSIEFVFEVDDTGVGIPKENRKSVFENFVQVRDTALEKGGTGLGLGIVQSLVRLMGGDIEIVEKELGERGTCFNFNIFLLTSDMGSSSNAARKNDSKALDHLIVNKLNQPLGQYIWNQSPRIEGSHVVLLIQGDERRKVLQNFMQSFLDLKVSALTEFEQLLDTVEKIKHRLYFNRHHDSSRKSESGYFADHLSISASFSSNAGIEHLSPFQRMRASRSTSGFTLIVIDDSLQSFSEVCTSVDNFRREIAASRCKVVRLVSSCTKIDASCHSVLKPFHGSRLYQVLRLLPEFGGNDIKETNLPTSMNEMAQASMEPNNIEFSNSGYSPSLQSPERCQLMASRGNSPSSYKIFNGKKMLADDLKPMDRKKVLVVENHNFQRKFALKIIVCLGAITESCEDGKAAVELICKAFKEIDQRVQEPSKFLPYDYIFMDCEMPEMDGYEATKHIRKEEQTYDVHIPIIALSAHEGKEAEAKSIEAGMDLHITKPLNKEKLLDAIHIINGKLGRTEGQTKTV